MSTQDLFYVQRQYNYFDNIQVDVKRVYKDFPIGDDLGWSVRESPFARVYSSPLLPLSLRVAIWRILRQIGLDQSWFLEFANYWSKVLRGRPLLGVHDLFFLKNVYRMRFQENQVPDTEDAFVHVEAWQRPELIYQLFHAAANYAYVTNAALIARVYGLKNGVQSILEYGCGTGPIAADLTTFYGRRKNVHVYVADIQTLAFHYAACRFRGFPNVTPVLLDPARGCRVDNIEPLDVIFCTTVFEHLNDPLGTVIDFHRLLVDGGVLVFDYIKSEGDGMDTVHGVRYRETVLEYVERHFEVLSGRLDRAESMGITIVRKRD